MNQGKIQQIAAPLNLYRQPANRFVAAFIGSPPMNFLTVSVKGAQLVHPAFTVPLSKEWEQALAKPLQGRITPHQNHPVTFGIRPEHIELGQRPGSIPATVTQIEALGSETFVLAQLLNSNSKPAASSLQIRVSADQPIQLGSTLQVNFPLAKIHLFDSHTEAAIRPT